MSKITFELIQKEIKREGIANVKFLIPMRKFEGKGLFKMRSDKEDLVECVIILPKTNNELHNELYNFTDGYKMYVQALDESYGKEDFYVDDFISLINDGRIKWLKVVH